MPTSKEELLRRGLTPHEIQHNQHRRAEWQDYGGTGLYMITLCIDGRHPLFGHLEGNISAKRGQADFPHIVLSPLGRTILEEELPKIHRFYPQIEMWQAAMMPDHLHLLLYVAEPLPQGKRLGDVIRSFKGGMQPRLVGKRNGGGDRAKKHGNSGGPCSRAFKRGQTSGPARLPFRGRLSRPHHQAPWNARHHQALYE